AVAGTVPLGEQQFGITPPRLGVVADTGHLLGVTECGTHRATRPCVFASPGAFARLYIFAQLCAFTCLCAFTSPGARSCLCARSSPQFLPLLPDHRCRLRPGAGLLFVLVRVGLI